MAAKRGRLESRFSHTAAWTATFTDSGGATAVDVPAGDQFMVDVIAAIDGDLGPAWSISVSDGESASTGFCTIHSTNTPWSITWTSTDLRDILGFAGNISSVSVAQTGSFPAVGLWLPDVVKTSQYGDSAQGSLVTDFRATRSPTGRVRGFFGNSYRVHEGVRWIGVTPARTLEFSAPLGLEGLTWEAFYLNAMTGRLSYIPVSALVRLYWDADVDGDYAEGRLDWPRRFDVAKLVETWNGRYVVDLPPLVVEG